MQETGPNETEGGRSWRRGSEVFALVGILVFGCILFLPSFEASREEARAGECLYRLRHLSLALNNYHDDYGSFPPSCITDESGKPIHSWRVLLLPYLDQEALYEQYKFDEPWDGPNNRKLHFERVDYYQSPADSGWTYKTRFTSFLAVTGKGTIWGKNKSLSISDVTDPHDSTIIVAEVAESGIHWMEPVDISLESLKQPGATWPPIGNRANDRFVKKRFGPFRTWDTCEHAALLGKQKAMRIKRTTTLNDLLPLFTINGGENTDSFFDDFVFDVR